MPAAPIQRFAIPSGAPSSRGCDGQKRSASKCATASATISSMAADASDVLHGIDRSGTCREGSIIGATPARQEQNPGPLRRPVTPPFQRPDDTLLPGRKAILGRVRYGAQGEDHDAAQASGDELGIV